MPRKRILVAPLNWGLGHGTRCIPLIKELLVQNFEPVLASDGHTLQLLKKEFPFLKSHILPSYNIRYARNSVFFGLKMFSQAPHIFRCIAEEKKITACIVESENINGIISDNRWGVWYPHVPSAFITHQIRVLSGISTPLSTYIQQQLIKKFDECWVPDNPDIPNLSGVMSHNLKTPFLVKHIGILSRMTKENLPILYDITVLLSGPEPQRQMLEEKLKAELSPTGLKLLFIKGIVEKEQWCHKSGNITWVNYLTSVQLQTALNSSELIICRPGYTSIMDLAQLEKKAFFIPTPGQPEQEYLAKKMQTEKLAASCRQEDFCLGELEAIRKYEKLSSFNFSRLNGIFTLFKCE